MYDIKLMNDDAYPVALIIVQWTRSEEAESHTYFYYQAEY